VSHPDVWFGVGAQVTLSVYVEGARPSGLTFTGADDVYAALVAAAEGSRQSLSAFVVARLSEVAQAVRVADYVSSYPAPRGTGVSTEEAVAAVREVREAS